MSVKVKNVEYSAHKKNIFYCDIKKKILRNALNFYDIDMSIKCKLSVSSKGGRSELRVPYIAFIFIINKYTYYYLCKQSR